jgi:hypothetical protein
MKKHLAVAIALTLVTVLGAGCSGALPYASTSTQNETSAIPAGMGRLEVRVIDAPPDYGAIKEIWVLVSEEDGVQVHKAVAEQEQAQEQTGEGEQNQVQNQGQNQEQQGEGEWIDIPLTGDNPFELLALKEQGVDSLLGWADVPAGKYTQIRMTIEEVTVIFDDGTEEGRPETAELPSGKLKLIQPFDLVDGETTIITLDFLADKSVNVTGQGDVIFKPVIKLTVSGKGGKGKQTGSEPSLEVTGNTTSTVLY